MSKQNIRLILWVFVLFLGFLLFNSWERDKISLENINNVNGDVYIDSSKDNSLDNINISKYLFVQDEKDLNDEIIVNTNLVFAKISLRGGDINFLVLKKYSKSLNESNDGVVVFDMSDDRYYIAQSGLLGNSGPDSKMLGRCLYLSEKKFYTMNDTDLQMEVKLSFLNDKNVIINKIYVFKSYSYDIDVCYSLFNNGIDVYSGRPYGLIKQKNIEVKQNIFSSNVTRSYTGGAVYTKDKHYKKLTYDDITNKKFYEVINNGWIAMLEHYFITSLIPSSNINCIYNTERTNDGFYLVKYLYENEIVVNPGEELSIKSVLYVGPKIKNLLSKLSNGLDLAIDYGIFWPISTPIFWLLSNLNILFCNWGLSIIFVTIIIKLLFFHLSSISYTSMGRMKELQPKLEILKDRYKDDKKKFGQALMDLYKKEGVNPLGGCLPVLVQIPVFISLYYVLLESVELRHAYFGFWVKDLSDKDPYYILPIIMSFTMYLQQKLSPPVQDPIQAKVMMVLPLVFLFLFLQFPSGLILYWIVNNILSIVQQWYIMRNVNIKKKL